MISLSFLGAVTTVTGSKILISVNNKKYLIDCGMFQGPKRLRKLNWVEPEFNPKDIEAVILTHAHIDHIGFLPKLVQLGFIGEIYASAPTAELARPLLLDSAHIQEEDADYRNRKKASSHGKALPLFTTGDAKQVFSNLVPVKLNKWNVLSDEFKFRYHSSGHILGAASIEAKISDGEKTVSILFSGDVGRYGIPLINDPKTPPETDYLVCESTYGGAFHPPMDIFFEIAELVDRIIKEKSVLIIPAFAVGRTQQITYIIGVLIKQGRIPPIPVHVDSPMAVRVTDIYRRFPSFHQINRELLKKEKNVFYGKNVTLHRKRKSSKKLNKVKGPAIIISASGMLSGGRILHHLINRLPDEKTTVALVGYMAEGTLGRRLLDGAETVYIHKQPIEVKASVVKLLGLSGHADSYELLHWLDPLKNKPKKVFINHGEVERSKAMAKQLKKEKGWDCYTPAMNETIELK